MRVQLPLAATVLLAGVTPTLAVSARAHHALLARTYHARRDSCVCPEPDAGGAESGGSSGASSGGSSGAADPAPVGGSVASNPVGFTSSNAPNAIGLRLPTKNHKKRRPIPKVAPSPQSLQGGVAQAIQDLVNKGIINATYGQSLEQAFNASFQDNTHYTTAPPSSVDNPTNIVWVQNKTATPASASSNTTSDSNSKSSTAILNIQQAIQDALNAATLAESNLNASTQAQIKSCLNTILSNGGLPSNYSCISQSGSTPSGLQQTLNNILEQFLGILPNKILQNVFDAVSPQLTNLLPDEQTLVANIESAIKSITASATGGSVTALEQLNNCYTSAIQANGNVSYANCFVSSGAYDTIQSSMNGVVEQFIGYLPPNLIGAVQNLVAYNLGTTNNASQANVYQQLNNAILSVGASLSGQTATQFEAFESCARMLLVEGNAAGAKNCTTGAAVVGGGSTLVNSMLQQYSGYVPASLLADLTAAMQPYLNGTTNNATLLAALRSAYDNADIGPGYVSCFEQIQSCVVNAVESSGNSKATCGGPVAGCERIGASGASGSAPIAPITASSTKASSTAASGTPAASKLAASVTDHVSTPAVSTPQFAPPTGATTAKTTSTTSTKASSTTSTSSKSVAAPSKRA